MLIKKNLISVLIAIVGFLLLSFIATKATISSFTHDESYTYQHYPHNSFMEIISHRYSYTNNHLLNTLGMKYSEQIFGNTEWALRLPNLLLFVIYLIYGYLLTRRFHPLLTLSIFVLLGTNGLLTDLFGMARGYGLSTGFMVIALFHFIESFYQRKVLNLGLFHLSGMLSVLSNLSLLTFYAALIVIQFLIVLAENYYFRTKDDPIRIYLTAQLLMIIPVMAILWEPVRRTVMYNDLNFGGKAGFFRDTVSSLITSSFHESVLPQHLIQLLQILCTGIVLGPFLLIVIKCLRKNSEFLRQHIGWIVTNLTLLLIAFSIFLSHQVLHTDYPVKRFAVFLYPLFILQMGFLFDYLLKRGYRRVILPFATGLAVISAINFVFNANLYSSAEWGYDRETKNMMHELGQNYNSNVNGNVNGNGNGNGKMKIGVNTLFEPSVNYYREKMDLKWLLPADRNGITKYDDYNYVFEEEFLQLEAEDYEVICRFESVGTVLVRRE